MPLTLQRQSHARHHPKLDPRRWVKRSNERRAKRGLPAWSAKAWRGGNNNTLPAGGDVWPVAIYWSFVNIGSPSKKFPVAIDSGSFTLDVPLVGCDGCVHQPPNNQYNPATSSSSVDFTCSLFSVRACSVFCLFFALFFCAHLFVCFRPAFLMELSARRRSARLATRTRRVCPRTLPSRAPLTACGTRTRCLGATVVRCRFNLAPSTTKRPILSNFRTLTVWSEWQDPGTYAQGVVFFCVITFFFPPFSNPQSVIGQLSSNNAIQAYEWSIW